MKIYYKNDSIINGNYTLSFRSITEALNSTCPTTSIDSTYIVSVTIENKEVLFKRELNKNNNYSFISNYSNNALTERAQHNNPKLNKAIEYQFKLLQQTKQQ